MLSKLRFFVQNHCKPLYAILLKVNTYLRKYSSRERKKNLGIVILRIQCTSYALDAKHLV